MRKPKKTDIELGYLAGMIDGEGTITIAVARNNKSPIPSHYVRVAIANTHLGSLERIQDCWGGKIITFGDDRTNRGWKTCYLWYLYSMPAIHLLEEVVEHLTIKRDQALVALRMKELHGIRGKKAGELVGQRESLKLEINELNRRGIAV